MCIKHLNSTYFRSRPASNQYHNSSSQPLPSQQQQQHHHQQQSSSMNSGGRYNFFRPGPANTGARPSQQQQQQQSSETTKEPPPKEIQEVRDISEIDTFSTKQLKYLLIKNCIDYKGVIEKEELRSRARQLWIDFNEKKARRSNRNQATNVQHNYDNDSDELDESQLCKICMEQEINCVLLECGHYLTCVTCGRKLSECPICRENVVRCVRTFKA